jgi:HPt (histidine-containing phosphotransfer) domain-containing protein
MNFKDLATRLEMEQGEFLEMIELFLEVSASDLNHLQAALEKGEGLKASRAAHSIKGAAVNLGLIEIYELAKKIETEALESHLDQSPEWISALQEKIGTMAKDLEKEIEGPKLR